MTMAVDLFENIEDPWTPFMWLLSETDSGNVKDIHKSDRPHRR